LELKQIFYENLGLLPSGSGGASFDELALTTPDPNELQTYINYIKIIIKNKIFRQVLQELTWLCPMNLYRE
jgi:hypothetical protein